MCSGVKRKLNARTYRATDFVERSDGSQRRHGFLHAAPGGGATAHGDGHADSGGGGRPTRSWTPAAVAGDLPLQRL